MCLFLFTVYNYVSILGLRRSPPRCEPILMARAAHDPHTNLQQHRPQSETFTQTRTFLYSWILNYKFCSMDVVENAHRWGVGE